MRHLYANLLNHLPAFIINDEDEDEDDAIGAFESLKALSGCRDDVCRSHRRLLSRAYRHVIDSKDCDNFTAVNFATVVSFVLSQQHLDQWVSFAVLVVVVYIVMVVVVMCFMVVYVFM